ncbi:hypothetical protein U8C37_25380 (plasmid) [Sinorhizobium medicae]|uniref:hypothetical protein n=1 Tax=Sinorhizobium medicae TaxID=110321 RepID=UPI002AF6AAE4|nr:hypothetical protein [Sinorhizobium medicae]WQO88046.1 hypothetical protein U8C37_25380 [Sinorhizobium medicae]
MRLEPHRLVFVDETSADTRIVRLRGPQPAGHETDRRCAVRPLGKQTFITGLRCHGITAPWVIDKAINRSGRARRPRKRRLLRVSAALQS